MSFPLLPVVYPERAAAAMEAAAATVQEMSNAASLVDDDYSMLGDLWLLVPLFVGYLVCNFLMHMLPASMGNQACGSAAVKTVSPLCSPVIAQATPPPIGSVALPVAFDVRASPVALAAPAPAPVGCELQEELLQLRSEIRRESLLQSERIFSF